MLREAIAEALQDDGYCVEVAGDGRTALALAMARLPHLIIVDLMLPFMDGEQLFTAIREVALLASTPVIIVSASRYTHEVAARVGAQAALRKPFDLDELSDRVRELLPEKPTAVAGSAH